MKIELKDMTIEKRVLEILKDTFDLDFVDETCSQQNCSAWDSMGQLNLVVDLEDAFAVRLEPEDIVEMKSFADVVRIIISKTQTTK